MEIRQTYNILDNNGEQVYFFAIISKLANYFSTNVLSRKRIVENKDFFSFIVMSASKSSLIKTSDYFNKSNIHFFPLNFWIISLGYIF